MPKDCSCVLHNRRTPELSRGRLYLHAAFRIGFGICNVLGIGLEKIWSICSAVVLNLVIDVESRVRHQVELCNDSYVQMAQYISYKKRVGGDYGFVPKLVMPPFRAL